MLGFKTWMRSNVIIWHHVYRSLPSSVRILILQDKTFWSSGTHNILVSESGGVSRLVMHLPQDTRVRVVARGCVYSSFVAAVCPLFHNSPSQLDQGKQWSHVFTESCHFFSLKRARTWEHDVMRGHPIEDPACTWPSWKYTERVNRLLPLSCITWCLTWEIKLWIDVAFHFFYWLISERKTTHWHIALSSGATIG